MNAHQDQSLISFTVGLNECSEYDGGGTFFECLDKVLYTDRGHFTAFAGSLTHAGAPITKGKRYILVLFCYATNWSSSGPPNDDDPVCYEWLKTVEEGPSSADSVSDDGLLLPALS